ncbi:MAG: sortase [Oscillospiraceae bacterium]|nr:sortase [Oscillospiraceae bacterium]
MRNKFGFFCMVTGAALVIAALALFVHNQIEANRAGETSAELLQQLMGKIDGGEQLDIWSGDTEEAVSVLPGTPVEYLDPSVLEMTEAEIDGFGYIGYLSFPSLGLKLPVMGDWDYTRLRIAPCRYSGSVLGEDLVIMAHNYSRHFGPLTELNEGDSVLFTDMDGKVTRYAVAAQDVLPPTAVEEMTAGEYDLTLFTCTYGGQSRITVYCDRESS